MPEILPVNYRSDILPEYRETPVGLLLEYHNLDRALGSGPGRQLLIGMCMDSRKALRIPHSRVTDIIKGRRGITADTALRLSRYFGNSAEFWLNLQAEYDLRMADSKRIEAEVAPRAA